MTFDGRGFLPLALPDVAPLTGQVYSGFGFRSTQDSGLLYHRASPVRPAAPPTASCSPTLAGSPPAALPSCSWGVGAQAVGGSKPGTGLVC